MSFAEKYTDRMFKLLASSYSTISITDMTHFTGMSKESATQCMHLLIIFYLTSSLGFSDMLYFRICLFFLFYIQLLYKMDGR